MEHVFEDRKNGGYWKIEIKDCPSCGSHKITASACETPIKGAYAYIMCDKCGYELAKYCKLDSTNEALRDIAEDWNKLGDMKPLPPLEEQVLRTWDAPLLRLCCPKCKRALAKVVKNCKYCGQEIDWKTKSQPKPIGVRKNDRS